MYIERGADGFDANALRQGDILAGVPFPLLDGTRMQVLGGIAPEYDYNGLPAITASTHNHRGDAEWVTVQLPVRFCLCAVLSNCCDLEPRNGGRPQAVGVNLARLRPISADIRGNADRFRSLKLNKDPRTLDPGYIDYFYLEPHALLGNQDWRVHFSQVTTIPISDIELLLRKKVLQLDDRNRVKFKIKLAFSLGRISDEEMDADLENPWRDDAQDEEQDQQPVPEQAAAPEGQA